MPAIVRYRSIKELFKYHLAYLLLVFICSVNAYPQEVQIDQNHFIVTYNPRLTVIGNTLVLPDYQFIQPKIALALSGGGSRGISQIGVLESLLRNDIEPNYVIGTSIGAFVGGLFASGYSPSELKEIVLNTNWDDFLDLTGDKSRSQFFQDQKIIYDRSLIRLRFENFKWIIPEGVSEGNKFKLYNQKLFLNSIYHSFNNYDELKYNFRAVATDLVTGQSIALGKGNIVSAITASATFPLRNSTVRIDSMILVDGGLFANMPSQVAHTFNPDIIIGVDNISPLNPTSSIDNAWIIADQVISLMMKRFSDSARKYADVIITPDIGNRNNADFSNLDSLISQGEKSASQHISKIKNLIAEKLENNLHNMIPENLKTKMFLKENLSSNNNELLNQIIKEWETKLTKNVPTSLNQIIKLIYSINKNEKYSNIRLDIQSDKITINADDIPVIKSLHIIDKNNKTDINQDFFQSSKTDMLLNSKNLKFLCEGILRFYRKLDYSFALISNITWDKQTSALTVEIDEGKLTNIKIKSSKDLSDYLIKRELQIGVGENIRTQSVLSSWENLVSSDLVEDADITFQRQTDNKNLIAEVNINEEPNQLLSVGVFLNNERYMQAGLDLIQINLFNSGVSADYRIAGGLRNFLTSFNLMQQRFLNTMITASITAYYKTQDIHVFTRDFDSRVNRYKTKITNDISEEAFGFNAIAGYRLSKNSIFSTEYRYEKQRHFFLSDSVKSSFKKLNTLKFGMIFDNENRFGFPLKGRKLGISFESSILPLEEASSFSKIYFKYQSHLTYGVHTLRPSFEFGFADKTLPYNEFFNMGGMESFFGLFENEQMGRQLLKGSLEYQVKLPIDIFFDTYFLLRYDLGSVWEVPESIKFESLKHGVGATLGINTPIGPAKLAIGELFYFIKSPSAVVVGYPHLYFSIGVNI